MAVPPTERRNPRTTEIDRLSTPELLRLLNDEDSTVPAAVSATLAQLADLVDAAVDALRAGRRLHYVGAGSSGRIAQLDAGELTQTFGAAGGLVVAHAAAHDVTAGHAPVDEEDAAAPVETAVFAHGDVVVGISASGRTHYVATRLRAARRAGALTALVSSDPGAPLAATVDLHVCAATGPEALAGSTRLKAGTAQKLILNALSTAVMVRLGRTWSNLMVHAVATNEKLRNRQVTILAEATGRPREQCARALAEGGAHTGVALLTLLTSATAPAAREALAATDGDLRAALRYLGSRGA